MRPPQTITCAMLAVFAFQLPSDAQTSGPSLGNGNLGSIARSLREKKSATAPNPPAVQDTTTAPPATVQAPARPLTPELSFKYKVERLLWEEKFSDLEKLAA